MNYKIYERTSFEHIHIVPAMGDDGSSMGAAIIAAIESGQDISWIKSCRLLMWLILGNV